jgi:hypothetical protein
MNRDDRRDQASLPGIAGPLSGAATYQAGVQLYGLNYAATDHLTLTGSYTHLHENSGVLGIQSTNPQDFQGGSTTDGFTVGMNWEIGPKLSLMATGTFGHTHQDDRGQTLAIDAAGLDSTAFEVAVARRDLFAKGDRLQVTLSQPMYVEHGGLKMTSVQVTDRDTGELGVVSQDIDIAGQRQIAGEAIYSRALPDGHGVVGMFGRVESAPSAGQSQVYMAGARYRIRF